MLNPTQIVYEVYCYLVTTVWKNVKSDKHLQSLRAHLFEMMVMFNAANALLAQCACLMLHIFIYDPHQTASQWREWIMCLLLRNDVFLIWICMRIMVLLLKSLHNNISWKCLCLCLQECPSGVVNEDTFKEIYSQFFPQGGECV